MAFCVNCGNELSDQAPVCPRCGHPRAAAQPRRTEGLAIGALILGILGITSCPLIASIPAVILGSQARARIEQDPALEGEGIARAGVILGWIGIGLSVLFIAAFIAALVAGLGSVGPRFDGPFRSA
jgi:hypothetical protein